MNLADLVDLQRDGGVATITMNRPEAMNALSRGLQNALVSIVDELNADPAVRVIVLTGAGRRAFSSGLDLKEIAAYGLALAPAAEGALDPVAALARCSKPLIGAINGVAVTGGLELALACDILIASSKARFADTHARMGVLPGWGLSQLLPRLIGLQRAMELSLSGNYIDAATAFSWGLVNRIVEPADLLASARQLASDISECDPATVARYKALIRDGYRLAYGDGLELERSRGGDALAGDSRESRATRVEGVRRRGQAKNG
jgi:enoyl-CoA hydratase